MSSVLQKLFSNKGFRARVHFHTCDVMLGLDTIVRELNELSQGTLVGAFGAAPRSLSVSGNQQEIQVKETTDTADVTALVSKDDEWVAGGLVRSHAARTIAGRVVEATLAWARAGSRWGFSVAARRVLGGRPVRVTKLRHPAEAEQ